MSAWSWFLAGVLSGVAVRLALAYAERLVRARAGRQRARLVVDVENLTRQNDRLREKIDRLVSELVAVRAERDRLRVELDAREVMQIARDELHGAPLAEDEEADPGLPAVLGGGKAGGS